MEKTDFAGLTRLDRGEPMSTDNFSFQNENPEVIDRLLRVGATTHKHDGHPALADPTQDVVVATGTSGGSLPSDTEVYVVYTLLDAYGGETAPVAPQLVTTQPGLATPDNAPDLELDHDAGTLLAGNYYYAVTVTDGKGGETVMGPQATITIEPGYANSQVTISGLQSLVEEGGGTEWRLWRMIDGGSLRMLGQGSGDSIVDDGSLCPNCSVSPPTSTSRTNSTNTLRVTVPGGQPAAAVSLRIYASVDGSFDSPALLGEYPIADAGTLKEFTELSLQDGSPPDVSRTVPGANKIDPDTDLLNFPWKRPVANAAALPQSGNGVGDIRETLDDNALHGWTGSAWVTVGGSGGGGGGGGGGGQYAGRLDMPAGDLTIPDNSTDVLDVPFTVPETADVGTIEVGMYVTHKYMTDVQISLISPTGTEVILSIGRGRRNYGTGTDDASMLWFSDGGATSVTAIATDDAVGKYKPEHKLSGLRGLAAGGTWKLRFFDKWSGDQGVVHAAALSFTKYTPLEGHRIKDEADAPLPQRQTLRFVGPVITATDDEANDATNVTVDLTRLLYGTDKIEMVASPESASPTVSIFGRDAFGDVYGSNPANFGFDYGDDANFPSTLQYQDQFVMETGATLLKVVGGMLAAKAAGQATLKVNPNEATYQKQRYVTGDFAVVIALTNVTLASLGQITLWAQTSTSQNYGMFLDVNPSGPTGPAMRLGFRDSANGYQYGPQSASGPRGAEEFATGSATNYVVLRKRNKTLTAELWINDTSFTNPLTSAVPAIRLTKTLPANSFGYSDGTLFIPRILWYPTVADGEKIDMIYSYQATKKKALWVAMSDTTFGKYAEKKVLDVDGLSDFI